MARKPRRNESNRHQTDVWHNQNSAVFTQSVRNMGREVKTVLRLQGVRLWVHFCD